jgi:probable phosphoglycerate mutase
VTVELILIRHAEPEPGSDAYAPDGRWDPPLSELGVQQAAALAERLRPRPPAAAVASSLARARQTAAVALDPVRAEPDPRWTEYHKGVHEKRTDRDGATPQERWAGGRWRSWPGGEDRAAFQARISTALAQAVSGRLGERLAIVTHSGVINQVLGLVLGFEVAAQFHIDHTGLVRLVAGAGGRITVAGVNDVWHLDDPLSVGAGALGR